MILISIFLRCALILAPFLQLCVVRCSASPLGEIEDQPRDTIWQGLNRLPHIRSDRPASLIKRIRKLPQFRPALQQARAYIQRQEPDMNDDAPLTAVALSLVPMRQTSSLWYQPSYYFDKIAVVFHTPTYEGVLLRTLESVDWTLIRHSTIQYFDEPFRLDDIEFDLDEAITKLNLSGLMGPWAEVIIYWPRGGTGLVYRFRRGTKAYVPGLHGRLDQLKPGWDIIEADTGVVHTVVV